METDLVYQPFAKEIGFIFAEMHIVVVAQRAVHDGEGMEREWRQLHGLGIDPSYGSCRLQAESCLVGKAHREIIGISGIGEPLHPVDVAPQEMRTEHPAVLYLRDCAVVTAVYTQIRIAMSEQFLEPFVIHAVQAVLRVVKSLAVSAFDEIDGLGVRHGGVLLNEPWEGVKRILMDVAKRPPDGFPFASH